MSFEFKQRLRRGEVAFFTTEQLPGAMANGTVVEKCASEPGDSHQDGDRATILGSVGEFPRQFGYFVEWVGHPGVPVFIASHRVREVSNAASSSEAHPKAGPRDS